MSGTALWFLAFFYLIGNYFDRKILHDPVEYPDPMSFKPERFLPDRDGKVPRDPTVSGAFGFGRRYLAFEILLILLNKFENAEFVLDGI